MRYYSTSRLGQVQIYLCPSVSICGSYFLMYCTQLITAIIAIFEILAMLSFFFYSIENLIAYSAFQIIRPQILGWREVLQAGFPP
jgi:hypothetical protein